MGHQQPSFSHPFVFLHLCLLLQSTAAVIHSSASSEINGGNQRLVYDHESNRYYPISDASLESDPPLFYPRANIYWLSPDVQDALRKHLDDPSPSFIHFFQRVWIAFDEFVLNGSRYPPTTMVLLKRVFKAISVKQVIHAICVAALLSISRWALHKTMLPLLVHQLGISANTATRLMTSSWKALWFLIMWLTSFYVLILSGRPDFYKPLQTISGLNIIVGYFDIPVSFDYYVLYTLQLAFYIHSIWTLLFVDPKCKDFTVLLVHHCVAILLLEFSLVLRLHRLGALVTFLHDLNDVLLELAKVNIYLRERHGEVHTVHDKCANSLFAVFFLSWILTRLYWYPTKVLYAASWGVYVVLAGRNCPTLLFFNCLLWSLFLMHLYWFRFIVMMAFRLLFYPPTCDIREEGMDEDETPTVSGDKTGKISDDTSHKSMSNGAVANHQYVANGTVRKRVKE